MTEKGRVPQCLSSCVLKEAGLVGEHELLWCLYLSPPPSFSLQVSLFFSAYWLWCPIVRSLSLSVSLAPSRTHTLSLSLSNACILSHTTLRLSVSRITAFKQSWWAGASGWAFGFITLSPASISLFFSTPVSLPLSRTHTHTHTRIQPKVHLLHHDNFLQLFVFQLFAAECLQPWFFFSYQ